MKCLYKYPQRAFPYDDLVAENRRRTRRDPEYELLDTGVFDDDRYFDVFIEYAKAAPDDILIRISAANRGPEAAHLHLLPTLWFRNTWSWDPGAKRPRLAAEKAGTVATVVAEHPEMEGLHRLYCEGAPELYFTENESNQERLHGTGNPTPFVKDAFHERVIHGNRDAVNPAGEGTKAAAHYRLVLEPGATAVMRLRPSGSTGATGNGSTSTTTTWSPCPTSGSTPGTRPGTSPFTPSRWPWWTRSSPRSSSCCSSGSGTCTPTARFRPTSGPSATSTRPSTLGRHGASTRSRSASG